MLNASPCDWDAFLVSEERHFSAHKDAFRVEAHFPQSNLKQVHILIDSTYSSQTKRQSMHYIYDRAGPGLGIRG